MDFREILEKIRKRYYETDLKSSELFLLAVFFEEAGELAEAVRKKDAESIEEELADCLFMILSLANYFNADVERRLIEKYIESDPSGRWDLPS
ncbi:MazG nucleotide pyrophosphohydrolase domain-containing protein [Geoglobus acetivorans]|uniref:MazG-related protein n=1 Tax=Geoglobus acetivorans TaxID=565033 RepID=A0A0A7GDC0_GEOAI|nr:MazG-related protein [Geoglobus acetivorans]